MRMSPLLVMFMLTAALSCVAAPRAWAAPAEAKPGNHIRQPVLPGRRGTTVANGAAELPAAATPVMPFNTAAAGLMRAQEVLDFGTGAAAPYWSRGRYRIARNPGKNGHACVNLAGRNVTFRPGLDGDNMASVALRNGLEDPLAHDGYSPLAAPRRLSASDMIQLGEPALFMVIFALVAFSIWRERRVPRKRQLVAFVLVPALPAFALLCSAVYMEIMYRGSSRQDVSSLGQLLEPIALALLLALVFVSWIRFERPARQRTVLAIGAHPDDIEFGCGATIQRLRKEGAATYGLVLTSGERGHDRAGASTLRADEARAGARVMALCDIEIQDFPDTLLHEHKEEIRSVIEAALTRWRPDIIFTHNGHDVHTDHHTIFEATREAARGAYTILCYENPNTPPGFQPGYFVDVSDYLDSKIAALSCHRTQTGKAYAAGSIVRAMAGFRGTQARVRLAEGFEVMRVLEKSRAK